MQLQPSHPIVCSGHQTPVTNRTTHTPGHSRDISAVHQRVWETRYSTYGLLLHLRFLHLQFCSLECRCRLRTPTCCLYIPQQPSCLCLRRFSGCCRRRVSCGPCTGDNQQESARERPVCKRERKREREREREREGESEQREGEQERSHRRKEAATLLLPQFTTVLTVLRWPQLLAPFYAARRPAQLSSPAWPP